LCNEDVCNIPLKISTTPDLDALLNKIFEPKNMKLKYLSTR